MYWANFLHIYQPPTQTPVILDRVAKESYRKVLDGLLANPKARVTFNIPGCLTEMLVAHGHQDIINSLRLLAERGQIEFTGSAMYHPFLPLLPESEIIRQIHLNQEANEKHIGRIFRPTGFFPPEMAYSSQLAKVIADLGFKWIILDEMALPTGVRYDPTKTYKNAAGMHFFFRERGASFKILSAQLGTASVLVREFGYRIDRKEYMLTAMDGETFGHHRLGLENLLLEIYKEPKLPTVTVSELLKLFPEEMTVEPRSSTWALMDWDVLSNAPYARWNDADNQIHQWQWQLLNLAIEVAGKEKEGSSGRQILDQAMHSDQFWWASARPWWSLEMIERGAKELMEAVDAGSKVTEKQKDKARELYFNIITTGFEWQRSGRVENLSRKEDEEIKQRMMSDLPRVNREEYNKMIENLRGQMLAASKNEEYARAEQFKKRISELTAERDKIPHDAAVEVTVNE